MDREAREDPNRAQDVEEEEQKVVVLDVARSHSSSNRKVREWTFFLLFLFSELSADIPPLPHKNKN